MEHQDWNTVVVRNKTKAPKKDFTKSNEMKMEENIDKGAMSHKKMDASYGRRVQQFRSSHGMTQKDLAQKLNIQMKEINEIESGKAKHNPGLMNKINRVIQK